MAALREDAGGALAVMTGVMLLRLGVSDLFLRYVKTAMRPWLLLAGVVFTVLGAVALVRAVRAPRSMTGGDSHGEAHAHGAVPRVSILLALPVMAVFLVAPSGLGSFAASRAAKAPVSRASGPALPLPPPRNGAVDLTLTDYAGRLGAGNTDFADVTVRLTGFVVIEPGTKNGFQLTRFQIACCAADARPTQVTIRELDGPVPQRDAWVEVTGRFDPSQPDAAVILSDSVRQVAQPRDPYE